MDSQQCECLNSNCNVRFPVVDGIPILLNEKSSLFKISDFVSGQYTFFPGSKRTWKNTLLRFVPTISKNIKARENYFTVAALLLQQSSFPRVLVIGGSILGQGMESLKDTSIELIETGVSMGPRTSMIPDAHDIPFDDDSFDGVIVQAVLEHVVDPYRCVEEIRSGATCGPGMALAWSFEYFLLSFVTSRTMRAIVRIFAHFVCFPLKYLDHYLINKPGTLDSASGYYFLGRKSRFILSDQDLLGLYKGAN